MRDTKVARGNGSCSQFFQDFGAEGALLTGKFFSWKYVCSFSPTEACGVFLQLLHTLLLSVLWRFLTQQGDKYRDLSLAAVKKHLGQKVGQRVYMGAVDLNTGLFNACFSSYVDACFNFCPYPAPCLAGRAPERLDV